MVRPALPPAGPAGTTGSEPWGITFSCGYRHVLSPNHFACIEGEEPTEHVYGVRSGGYAHLLNPATSHHPGGINLLLLDGSVRFVGETIASSAWRALGTRAGGEVVSSSDR